MLVGCSLLYGLLTQSVGRLLALMESANWVPFCFSSYDAFDVRRVVPVPGLTGFAITSLRSRNLVNELDPIGGTTGGWI